jgi:hypothetical protein
MKTRYCDSCEEFFPDIVGYEVRCTAGFSPRFYKDGGFKRQCGHFVSLASPSQIEENKETLHEMGYKYD